jgi:hypothetical protein
MTVADLSRAATALSMQIASVDARTTVSGVVA